MDKLVIRVCFHTAYDGGELLNLDVAKWDGSDLCPVLARGRS